MCPVDFTDSVLPRDSEAAAKRCIIVTIIHLDYLLYPELPPERRILRAGGVMQAIVLIAAIF